MPLKPTPSPAPIKLYPSPAVSSNAVLILRESASKDLKERTQFYVRKTHPTLCCTTTYINHLSRGPEETNPFCRPHPGLLVPLRFCLSASLGDKSCQASRTQTSRSNFGSGFAPPGKPLSKDLNKRTQFLPPNPTLTSFATTTYIQPLSPALNRTNPISPTSLPVSRPSKILTTASCLLTPLCRDAAYRLLYPMFYILSSLLTPDSPLLNPVFRKTNPISPTRQPP